MQRHLSPSSERFEPRFPDGWVVVLVYLILVYLIHNLNVIICPLKKEILNELIVNYEFFYCFLSREDINTFQIETKT